MHRGRKRAVSTRNQHTQQDDDEVHSLVDFQKVKHRSCEYKRRKTESSMIDQIKRFLATSKRFHNDPITKIERLQLLACATTYIQENVSTLNILLGVLCSTLLHSKDIQLAMEFSPQDESEIDRASLLDALGVPPSTDELLEQIVQKRFDTCFETDIPTETMD